MQDRKKLRLPAALFILLLAIALSACSALEGAELPFDLSFLTPQVSTPLPVDGTAEAIGSATATAAVTSAAATAQAGGSGGASPTGSAESPETPEESGAMMQPLTLWVPPEFDPASGSPAGDLLRERLGQFSAENNGVAVYVRVKAVSGPSSLLESLSAASAAAPKTLPSVVAFSRADLEAAALKELIFPLDGLSTEIDQPDWYEYARQLSLVQGSTFSLPFAGDLMVLTYRPEGLLVSPDDWPAIFRIGQPVGFPAGDPQAMMVLSLYSSLDGEVEDSQRRPTIQPELLSQVYQLLADGEQRGIFPYWLSQYETSGQVWQAYRDGRVNAAVTWVSNYLSTMPSDTVAAPLPSMDSTQQPLATAWGWAVAEPDPQRRELAVRLAEFLSDGTFLGEWTEAAGYMPARPSALAAWKNQSHKTLLSPLAVSARARPTVDQLASLGPPLKEGLLNVLKREIDPTQAAQIAAEKLAVPETFK